jgi:hypothetical protein
MFIWFLTQSLNSTLVARRMSTRNPTTRRSLREPKLKEPEMRKLDYSLREEPVIKTSTKKYFPQPPVFGDTKESTRSKATLPQWGDIFNKISQEEYPEYIPHNIPDVRELDDQVFPNIRRSYLHMVASRTPIFPCIKVLKWFIDHTDGHKFLINDENGGCIRFFLLTEVQKYYKLRSLEERLNTDFMVKLYEFHDNNRLMASWWREDKKFTNRSNGWYGTINLKEPYIYLVALICRLYGEKYCSEFS